MTGTPTPPLLTEARAAIAAGDHPTALKALRAIPPNPADPGLHAALAWEFLRVNQPEEAEALCTSALALTPDRPDLLLRLGLIARRRGDRQAAIGHFRAVLRHKPDDTWAHLELSLDLLHTGQLEEAEALCQALLAAGRQPAQALIRLGLIAGRRGDKAAALGRFEAALAAEPGHGWALRERDRMRAEIGAGPAPPQPTRPALVAAGRAAFRQGQAEAGAAHLRAALALGPADPGLQAELAWELLKRGGLDEAEALCRAGLALAPGHADLLLRLGLVARRRGDRDAAMGHFRDALRSRPGHGWARQELAAELIQADRLEEAEATLRVLLEWEPANAQAHIRLGFIARRRGDRAAALRYFQAAQGLAPQDAWAGMELSAELREAGRMAEALACLAPYLAAAPGHAGLLRQRGLALLAAGDPAAARESLLAAFAAEPESVQATIDLARAERALGANAEAERLMAAALARAPTSIGLLHTLIGWRREDDAPEEAAALCQRAIDAQPDQPWLYALLAQIMDMAGVEADAVLSAALARFGLDTALVAERVRQLRRSGEAAAARSVLAQLPEAVLRGQFSLWFLAREIALQLGETDAAEAAAADPPPVTAPWEKASLQLLLGQIASARWDLEGAQARFAEAAALHPDNPLPHHELGRLALLRLDMPAAREALHRWMRAGQRPGAPRRAPWNLRQTLPGQLVQEFELGRDTLLALRRIMAGPPEAQLAALRDQVLADTGQTSAALMLLLWLRRAGLLDPGAEAGGGAEGERIPRRIVQFWTAAEPEPDLLPLLQSWQAMNPDHAYRRFDNETAAAYLRDRHAPAVFQAFRQARQPAQRADVFRLAYLGAEGGIWADADDRCIAPLSTILGPGLRFLAYQEDFGSVANNILAVAPGHPAVLSALDQAVAAVLRGDSEMIWLSTGPGLLSRALAAELASGPLATALQGTRLLTRTQMQRAVSMFTPVRYKQTMRSWSYQALAAGAAKVRAAAEA